MSGRYKKPTYEIRVSRLNESPGSFRVDGPEAATAYWAEKISAMPWYDPEREMCVVIMLNTRYTAFGHSLVSIGSLNESVCHPRDIFRPALACAAFAIVVAHNHPSGVAEPSEADLRLTRRLAEAGQLLQIALVDHVIVGAPGERPGRFSFREAGHL
jgi:DNA repair protein RadC